MRSVQPSYLNATQRFFLLRIERLLRLREEYETLLRPDDWENRLLNKAIYSTYCDCLNLGVGREAKERLDRRHSHTA
ncbi:MAG: hypothetical protein M0Z94_14445 [Dehalococcoidales bacterium]|nr:hypothetical protein [Dehalococcoidales bacterium]